MLTNFIRRFVFTSSLVFSTLIMFAQAPFTGTSQFRKFSVGVNAGVLSPSVITGGSNDFTKPLITFGYGANVKYQFTHHFALQGDFLKGHLKGNNDKDYWNGQPAINRPNSSFNTDMLYALSLNGVFTLGNINWISKKNSVVPYVSAGMGTVRYKTKITPTGGTEEDFNDGKALNEMIVPVGVGLKIGLTDLVNLDLGYRANFVDNDNFDGTSFNGSVHKDKFSYGFLGVEFALGKKSKKQLMFNNPAYQAIDMLTSQVNQLKGQVDSLHAQMIDSDQDGVFDQFDKCPETPEGVKVDSHGCPLDSDGDGVPDYKDKELITPTQCQPVDADGVGKCPEPDCCKNMVAANACNLGDLPSITFRSGSATLSNDGKAMLATIASKLRNSPDCSVTITGYPAASKSSQSLNNKRLNTAKSYLLEKEGISADRITTNSQPGAGDMNVIDIKAN